MLLFDVLLFIIIITYNNHYHYIARPRISVSALNSIQLWKHLVIGQSLVTISRWYPIRMTLVSFVKTSDSFEVCRLGHHLGTVNPLYNVIRRFNSKIRYNVNSVCI